MKKYILSIDAGTTGITIILLDTNSNLIDSYYSEIKQYFPKPGWVEQDCNEIWDITLKLMQSAFKNYDINNCICIGITNQRETTVVWDKNNDTPVYNAIVWQCKRTQNLCNELIKQGYTKTIQQKTGLVIDSYFSATKIQWIITKISNSNTNVISDNLIFGTIDTWLIWKLSLGESHVTDMSNASRTMLFNINDLKWDKELLTLFNIPKSMLPIVKYSASHFGDVHKNIFNKSIPITGVAGDQQAALFGQQCYNSGDSKCTYGTGCFLLTNTGKTKITSSAGLITTIACDKNGEPNYALEGSVFIGGAIIQWLKDELNLLNNVKDSEKIAQSIPDSNGVTIVPAFSGLGAPYWNMESRGIIAGLTRGVNKNHIIRAALECIAFQVYDLLNAIYKDTNVKIPFLKVDGGASSNNFLMQFQSNLLNTQINRPQYIESTAIGAALLAQKGLNLLNKNFQFKSIKENNTIFKPNNNEISRTKLINNWHKAIKQAQH